MSIKDQLKEYEEFLQSLKAPAKKEAIDLFPGFPLAQDIYVKLMSGGGGIEDVVKKLSLEKEYNNYTREYNNYLDKKLYESASLCVGNFINYCLDQLKDNFYLFK